MDSTSITPTCPKCRSKRFKVRILKDEGIGCAQCLKCERHYLLLDSAEYWFDVIQKTYPRLCRCKCKSESFQLRFDYEFRDGSEDIQYIQISTVCTECDKEAHRASLDIKYSDTAALIETPLIHCPNPEIFYELKQLNLFITEADIARIIEFLSGFEGVQFYCWALQDRQWHPQLCAGPAAKKVVAGRYLNVFAMFEKLDEETLKSSRDKDTFWKHNAVIRISSPSHIRYEVDNQDAMGTLYYIEFSTEFIHDGAVQKKSKEFRAITDKLLNWLKEHFVSWRGKLCFDNPTEHERLFRDRFRK